MTGPVETGTAGQPAQASEVELVDVPKLVAAYYVICPEPRVPSQRVAFGTSGHRGSALDASFNEWHILAITQAICRHRKAAGIGGPLFIGVDTHALSAPACASALEVLAANGVEVMLAAGDEFTPTPVVSHAILGYNRGKAPGDTSRADGIVVTPSHNPPRDGGFKYNPPHGGPASQDITKWIEAEANRLLEANLAGVQRMSHARALKASTTHRHDFLNAYVADLGEVIDMGVIRDAGVRIGVDPMGGAGIHYWSAIAKQYGLDLTVTNDKVDPAFAFMPPDWDGQIRMDPSSRPAMQHLVDLKNQFDVAFACDTDHDRHGIVVPVMGLMPPNHYLAVSIDFLFKHRVNWARDVGIGKTVVSSRLIDKVAAKLGRTLFEAPVGFKWFAEGLAQGRLGFAGEESAGATFLRRDGTAWTTDKDGMVAGLLAAEITARTYHHPGHCYAALAGALGNPVEQRVQAPASAAQRRRLSQLKASEVSTRELAGERVESILTQMPGSGEPIGGIKVSTASGWFAARPSGTENIYKIYGESFKGSHHLQQLMAQAKSMVDAVISGAA